MKTLNYQSSIKINFIMECIFSIKNMRVDIVVHKQ